MGCAASGVVGSSDKLGGVALLHSRRVRRRNAAVHRRPSVTLAGGFFRLDVDDAGNDAAARRAVGPARWISQPS